MRLKLRTKLLSIVAMVAVALVSVIVVSALLSARVDQEVTRVRQIYLPLVALGPKLEAKYDRLTRSFQDAIAAKDLEALSRTDVAVEDILADIAGAAGAVDPAMARAAETALESYHQLAQEVSRRLIAGETSEDLHESLALMQTLQQDARKALHDAVELDSDALQRAFGAVAEAQATAVEARLIVSVAFLAAVLLLSFALARGVLRSLNQLEAGLGRFGKGDFTRTIPVTTKDELAKLAIRANEMAKSLERLAEERRRTEWLEAGQAELARKLRGELSPYEVAANALAFYTSRLSAPVAALYQAGPDDNLLLRALHAPTKVSDVGVSAVHSFRRGEGLVGQAAMDKEIVVVPGPPSDYYLQVRSALGQGSPAALVLVPLVRGEEVAGVIELGLLKPLSELERKLLVTTRASVAIALGVAHAHAETRVLLAETQAQRRTLTERNAALDESRRELERKAEQLATVSAYKSQFLANMSHELRTPLNSMLLLSSLLADNEARNLTAKQVEYCRTIHSAGQDLLGLINQVLDLAKVEAGKYEITIGPVKPRDLAERMRRVFEPLARDKNLELVVAVGKGVPAEIRSDDSRLQQILTNLLGNAIKFTERGSVTLWIARAARDAQFKRPELSADSAIAFSVSDTGPGISERDQERIFLPFEQLESSPDRRHGGTGLGLSLVRELTNLLGGEIQLESEVGVGTTFTCYLPGDATVRRHPRKSDLMLVPPGMEAALDDDRDNLAAGERHLLVIDDDASFAHAFAEVIHRHGLKCLIAKSGDEGFELAARTRPDGIVLDVRLPDTDGFEVMARLRANETTAKIPVHFVSALDDRERGVGSGAIGYLVKPADRRDLVRVIEALVPDAAAEARRILVVEDDLVTGDVLLKMLAAERLVAERVTSAASAMSALREQGYGCIVLDLALPDMDGLTLLERIREERGDQMPAVVIYTGRSLSRDEAQRLDEYSEAIVLKEGASAERLLNEIRLFVRRLSEGIKPRRKLPVPEPQPDLDLKGKKALVVDDDMRTVYALSAALRGKGMEVHIADNGRAALETLELRPAIDVVLMDIMMPEMDGYEAMRRIRQDGRFADLPIIALTAKAMKDDAELCYQAGASDYLPKPIDATRLLGLIRERLSSAGSANS